MDFNGDLGQYVYEYQDLIFAWDEEPEEDVQDIVKKLAENYYSHLNEIVDFMLPDIIDMFGETSAEVLKNNLGKPIIDYDNGRVTYVEQTLDDSHIFEFEFMDDTFEDLQYFSIDG